MKADRLQEYLEALRQAPDDTARSGVLESAQHQILKVPDTAKELIGRLGTKAPDSEAHENLMMLLEAALEAARMAQENRKSEGEQFLAAIHEQLGLRAAAGTLSTADRFELGRAYIRAGLAPSEHLIMDAEGFNEIGDDPPAVPDLEALLDNLRDEVGAEPMAFHMALSEMMSTFPSPVRAMIVDQIARHPDHLYAWAGAYWMLDADATLRRSAAEGFLQRTLSGQMDAATVARLIGIRSWLPADAARDILDRLIKEAIRRDVAGGTAPKSWKLYRILASIPDGVGAQSIAVVAQASGQRVIAMLLLKEGFGVKDAYLIPCASASEQKRFVATLSEEIDPEEVTVAFVRDAIATALADGMEAGFLAAPGLIDVVEVCGLQDLHPEPKSVQDMVGTIAADGKLTALSPQRLGRLVGRSTDWPECFDMLESWFEDSGELRDVLAAAATQRAREQEMWRYLETRRGWWARIFARTALTLQAADDPFWIEFMATAAALEEGRDLKKTPIMQYIASRSLENPGAPGSLPRADSLVAPEIDFLDTPAFFAPEKKNELARLLKASDISPDWLDGFLMAIVVSPKMITPKRWLEPIFDALHDLPNEETLQRILDIVMLRYNSWNAAAQDPVALKRRMNGLSVQAWADWAAGFVAMTTKFKSSWPTRTLNKDDKAILRQVDETFSSGNGAGSLAAILPAWLARRYELRS